MLAIRASDQSAWQERGLDDRVREAFRLPVMVFAIDRAGHVPSDSVEDYC